VSLLLHAITTRPDSVVSPTGARGQPVIASEICGLTVWAADLPEDIAPFTKQDMLDHHQVVMEIFARAEACLPARFPTLLPDVASLRTHVASRVEELAGSLERVRDACELAVTAAWSPPLQESTETVTETVRETDTGTSPGRRYLLQRQLAFTGAEHRHARAGELADEIVAAVGADLLEVSRHLVPSRGIALSLALLVRRDAAADVSARIPRTQPDVRILVSGPWAPYTFAGVRSEQGSG
jgi:hypothetical protein